MTREKMYYIAYTICDYFRKCEMQKQFEDYEFCMYVSDMASDIEYAVKTNNDSSLKTYYEALYDELDDLVDSEYVEEVKELIDLLDEWKRG